MSASSDQAVSADDINSHAKLEQDDVHKRKEPCDHSHVLPSNQSEAPPSQEPPSKRLKVGDDPALGQAAVDENIEASAEKLSARKRPPSPSGSGGASDDDTEEPALLSGRTAGNTDELRAKHAQEFNSNLFELIHFKAVNGNFHVSRDDNVHLVSWLQHLKREYKLYLNSSVGGVTYLTEKQVKVLEYLHVPLTSKGDDHWNRFYELLEQYGERHGHVLVPRLCEVPGLGDWVTDQRRQYKAWKQGQPSQLTKDRREKLEALGFVWQVRNRPEWEHRFQELLNYKALHGDCKVPQHYKENRALGKWVAKQREQYKLLMKGQHSFMTPYRFEKLNNAGFVWHVRTALEDDDSSGGARKLGTLPATEGRAATSYPQMEATKDPTASTNVERV